MDLKKGHTRLIINVCAANGLLRNQAAYVLATAYHETAHTMQPVREYGGEAYLRSKPYYPYVGRGFVQLTWKANYEEAGRRLGNDFVSNPNLLMKPEIAAKILVIGSRDGWFTKKKLADYITLQRSDFKGARKIINGTDKASLIAGYAKEYDQQLEIEGYGENTAQKPVETPKPVPAPTPKHATPPAAAAGGFWQAFARILTKLFRGGR